ncbi:TMEM165/GDT1 family protein [Gayadomonas joobiniege]|uniref:TMEM165/GDT1 family protein n=1 Tax=Gayadomonas joobiniege TaxID=1234606 RepID=UPI0003829FDD|nr:TMEM165/GDT1 family protein [Gayadomonas joobiniege]
MDTFLTSTLSVAVAEIGDKTQLLTLFLVARYHRPLAIIAGITVATLFNHGLSAWLGDSIIDFIPQAWVSLILAISFILLGLWLLIPDKEESEDSNWFKYNAFIASCGLFFIAEIGDKTQLATVLLAAKYQDLWLVTAGTTLGMLVANVPVAYTGQWLLQKINMQWVHFFASAIFIITGIATLVFS